MIIVLILNFPIIYSLIIAPKITANKYNAVENKNVPIFINVISNSPEFSLVHLIQLLTFQFFLDYKNNHSKSHQNLKNNLQHPHLYLRYLFYFTSLAQTLGAAEPSTAASGGDTCEEDEGYRTPIGWNKGY